MPPTITTRLTVNGATHDVTAAPDTPLLYVLRNDLGLTGPKFGCGLGQCGACMVHIDGDAVRSCTTPLSAAARGPITTIEGLGTPDKPHPVQQAFIEEQAAQCGYCINGMIMAHGRACRAEQTPDENADPLDVEREPLPLRNAYAHHARR